MFCKEICKCASIHTKFKEGAGLWSAGVIALMFVPVHILICTSTGICNTEAEVGHLFLKRVNLALV